MKKFILFFVLLTVVLSQNVLIAQTPKYIFTNYPNAQGSNGSRSFSADNSAIRIQSIYYPTDFPTVPAGPIKSLYFRIGRLPLGVNVAVYPKFTVRIGYTSDSIFTLGSGQWDTFKTGLTIVYGPTTFTTPADSIGRWVRIPLTTPWNYSLEQKFVVEYAMGPKNNNTGFDIMCNNRGTVYRNRTASGPRDSVRVFNNSTALMMDIGFDFQTTGIEALGNFRSFGLFPNPSQGRFMVSLESATTLGSVSFYLNNVAGQLVARKELVESGTSLLRELEFGSLPAGVYILEVSAGGDKLSRRVIIR